MVWGVDWNHALGGPELSGSRAGRLAIRRALNELGLQAPTAQAPHRLDGMLSIDHVAVPSRWTIRSVEHHHAQHRGTRLSDHDAYVVDVDPT